MFMLKNYTCNIIHTNFFSSFWEKMKIEWTATIWIKWQIVIPKQARTKFDLQVWDDLVVLSGKLWIILVKSEKLENMMDSFEEMLDN